MAKTAGSIASMSDNTDQWYFDTASGEVTQGKVSGWDTRMGPYNSAEDARRALETARSRADAADKWDED